MKGRGRMHDIVNVGRRLTVIVLKQLTISGLVMNDSGSKIHFMMFRPEMCAFHHTTCRQVNESAGPSIRPPSLASKGDPPSYRGRVRDRKKTHMRRYVTTPWHESGELLVVRRQLFTRDQSVEVDERRRAIDLVSLRTTSHGKTGRPAFS